jgi:hypothetical protein
MLSGCSAPAPSPSPSTTSASPRASASPTPTTPTIVPGGSAAENLPVFTDVVAKVWAGPDKAAGRAYIDALVGAGFDKAAMQVTNDTSTVGNPAESIEFSVLWSGGECLVGQVGPAIGNPVTAVLPELSDGTCLLGKTRTIDW